MTDPPETPPERAPNPWIARVIRFCLENRLAVALAVLFFVGAGLVVAPFDWPLWGLPRSPVPTDAIPDIGENQQVVFTEWPGRSPQDVQDQITYPLTTALLGVPGVKTVRSVSDFGFSSIYIIFDDRADFHWSRSRVLEKLNSLPADTLPPAVQPMLGPDATALGQVFWYTLEGRDPRGNPVGGWNLEELRTIQDWQVRYGLYAEGVSEVASVGGFVREYQVDVDPDAMRAYGVTLDEVRRAVETSNVDVGAKVIELNRAEYLVRGVGFIKRVADVENSVIRSTDNVPVLIRHVARVSLGPELRRGALDKEGAEAVGGVVVTRYGANPLQVIANVKKRIDEIAPALPARAVIDFTRTTPGDVRRFAEARGFQAFDGPDLNQPAWLSFLRAAPRADWPPWADLSQVTIVPFYDRTGLIHETLATLNDAIALEILVTVIVVVIMVVHLRSSILIGGLLPLAVLMCFLAMRIFGVDANIVALSGIAIAIGTMVDMGIVICENILRHLQEAPPEESRLEVVFRASTEVGGAVLTAVATTVVGFLPVFTMTGPEGKLFKPLAYTKTFALIASVIVALTVIPPAAQLLFPLRIKPGRLRHVLTAALVAAGAAVAFWLAWWAGLVLALLGLYYLAEHRLPPWARKLGPWVINGAAVVFVGVLLTVNWLPVGPARGFLRNFIFVAVLIGALLGFYHLFQRIYSPVLRWCLAHKVAFLSMPLFLVILGLVIWLGFDRVFAFLPGVARKAGLSPQAVRHTDFWVGLSHKFPGLGREFMPPLDEGSFLYMPTTMPHASIGEALDIIQKQDMALRAIPEIDSVVGKIGRADTALDPAPPSMIETVISYKPEYALDDAGRRANFRYDTRRADFVRDADGRLIPDPRGRPCRQWRPHVRSPDDIWREIVRAADIPGTTSAPRLQPIAARIVMLQSGMRAPMGVKIKGPDLEAIEKAALDVERLLKDVPAVEPDTVIADRIVGKPYLEIVPDRDALARYGVPIRAFQDVVEVAIGGERVTTTVEGPRRFPVRVRYQRELRDRIETIGRILIPASGEVQIPLQQLAEIRYVRGPQMIKSEDTFLVAYVLFDKKPGYAEVDVVEACRDYLDLKMADGELVLPPGVARPVFAGTYESQVRSQKTLALVLPLALFLIFMILYFQFKSVPTTSLVFSGILVAWAGGFLLIWLYAQPRFLDFHVFGVNMRDLFQVHPVNLSVAVWVGFLALFGIASDDGVVMATYLDQSFTRRRVASVADIRDATVAAGRRRVRPCLMTTATTVLALIPVLTATGRGSDIMVPMAIPSFGGMIIEVLTMLVVPVLYCWIKERKLAAGIPDRHFNL